MSAAEYNGMSLTALTTEAVAKYTLAKITTTAAGSRTCAMADAGEKAIGVFCEAYGSGEIATIFINGVGKLICNGNSVNIVAGDPIKAATNGVGVKAATDEDCANAIALDPLTADGVAIDVIITPTSFIGAA